MKLRKLKEGVLTYGSLVAARFRGLVLRRNGQTSTLGVILQLIGLLALIQGLGMVYWPLSYLTAGLALLLIGEKL